MANNNFAIAVFLDINGAFSNTSIEGMIQNLQRRNLHPQISQWIKHMPENRTVTATLHSETVSKKINSGTPQGGILPPTIFNFDVEDCLEQIPQNGQLTYSDMQMILCTLVLE